jgi:hypothetical protein
MTTERDVLDEIANIITHNQVRGSARKSNAQGKVFYDSLELPEKLAAYVNDPRRQKLSDAARMFGMSAKTLKSLIDGGPLSENMLFRLRNSLEYALQHPSISVERDADDTYTGDWRATTTIEIQSAINDVAEKLIFLKRIIESSNSLKSAESPIDKIQIAQLVALLEATLVAIKAPLVDTQSTAGFFRWLGKLGKRGVEKGVERIVSDAIDSAKDAGSELLKRLGDAPGTSDLGSIIS